MIFSAFRKRQKHKMKSVTYITQTVLKSTKQTKLSTECFNYSKPIAFFEFSVQPGLTLSSEKYRYFTVMNLLCAVSSSFLQ